MPNPLEPLAAIAAPVKDITELLNKFLSPPLQEAGEVVGARVRVFRLKQETKLLQRALKILEEAGLKPKAVNLRVLFPLLDAAVLEEDEQMAERWASLLASAADPDNNSTLEASYIEILKQLAPSHAFLLDVFYEQIERANRPPEEWSAHGVIFSYLESFLKKEVPQFSVAIDNLLRLRLVEHPTAKLGVANGQDVQVQVVSSDILCATGLGMAFVSACRRGRTPRNVGYGVPGNSTSNVFWTRGGDLKILPSPAPKLLPADVTPELKLKTETEAHAIATKIGFPSPGVGLYQRRLLVSVGKNNLPLEAVAPLLEFCADRGLQLEIHQNS